MHTWAASLCRWGTWLEVHGLLTMGVQVQGLRLVEHWLPLLLGTDTAPISVATWIRLLPQLAVKVVP